MKIASSLICLVLLISCVAFATAADTTTSTSTSSTSSTETALAAAAQVYVSGVELDPPVFYPGEPGTITVHVTNAGDQTVTLGDPAIIDPNLKVYTKNSFQAKTNVGPGSTVNFIFLASVNGGEGKNTYFPFFTVSPTLGDSIHASFKLVSDSREIQASISSKPDAFTLSNPGTVNLSVVNPRDGALKNIMITAEGPGLQVSPSKKFVSSLDASESVELPFSVTPGQESNLTFTISYQGGDTTHSTEVVLPITLGDDKMAAVPVINNVALTSRGTYYDITGDVTNAGISDAKGLVIVVGSPAEGTGKYPEYAVGSLAADDSSSFELTFTAPDLSHVPIVLHWKDSYGNNYAANKTLDLRSDTVSSGTSAGTSVSSGRSSGNTSGTYYTGPGGNVPGRSPGSGTILGIGGSRGNGMSAFYPLIAGGIILVVAIVLYVKRRPIKAKLAGMKRKPNQ
jgi:archaellum component FlaG (FlaF/FlaG flagellin family)